MKGTRIIAIVIGELLLTAAAPPRAAPVVDGVTLRVATFNVHYLDVRDDPGDGERPAVTRWEPRDRAVVSVLRYADADILAFQEMETFAGGHANSLNLQQETLQDAFPRYSFTATGDPEVFPSTQPVMYRRCLALGPLPRGCRSPDS